MKLNYKFASFLNRPIYFNASIILVFLYFAATDGVVDGIIMSICFLILMLVHEMGHAWFVKKYGHELIEIKIYPIHGHCLYEYDSRFEPETLVYAGGLIAQILMLVLWGTIVTVLEFFNQTGVLLAIEPVTSVFITINIIIFVLNSLPIPGLDGFELWKRLGEYMMMKSNELIRRFRRRKPKVFKSPEKVVNLAVKRAQRSK